jgi:renal tumor antigen
MKKLLEYDPDERIVARQALKDPYFRDLREAERQAAGQAEAAAAARSQVETRPVNQGMASGCSSSSSVSSAAAPQHGGHGGISGVVGAPELSTVSEPSPQENEPQSSSTLPALGGGTGRLNKEPFAALGGGDLHAEEDDPPAEDSNTLPPIGKTMGRSNDKQRTGKEKKETKAFKAVANATLRGSSGSFHINPAASETASSSKGFERQPQGAASLANSAYGKKFGQSTTLQSSTFGQSTFGQSSNFGQSANFGQTNASSYAGNPVAAERRDPKALSRQHGQYVSPYSHKQIKR